MVAILPEKVKRNLGMSVLFGIAGLASGFVTVWIYSSQLWPASYIGGAIFLAASSGALAIVKALGHQPPSFGLSRCVAAAALVSVSHPAAIWIQSLTEVVADLFCRLTISPSICSFHVANAWGGFLLIAFPILLVAVGVLPVSLWLLTGRWENREFILLVLGGIGTTWNSMVLTLLLLDFGCPFRLNGQDWTYFLTLALVGEPLLLVISAHWIFKQSRSDS